MKEKITDYEKAAKVVGRYTTELAKAILIGGSDDTVDREYFSLANEDKTEVIGAGQLEHTFVRTQAGVVFEITQSTNNYHSGLEEVSTKIKLWSLESITRFLNTNITLAVVTIHKDDRAEFRHTIGVKDDCGEPTDSMEHVADDNVRVLRWFNDQLECAERMDEDEVAAYSSKNPHIDNNEFIDLISTPAYKVGRVAKLGRAIMNRARKSS